MKCIYCHGICIRKGFAGTVQRYCCKSCKRYQQKTYTYHRFGETEKKGIINHIRNACGIRDTSRLMELPASSVVMAIKRYASRVIPIVPDETGQKYQMDEMHIKIAGEKDIYLAYAFNKKTNCIIDFSVGRRTKESIRKVVKTLLRLSPKRVYTDGLNLYPGLLGKTIHRANKFFTVHIERKNATLRTHLKRFSESGLSYSRSIEMIEACMKLYLRG